MITSGQLRSEQMPTTLEPQPTILVVDDEPDVRELVKDILESGGYRVATAENGRQARDYAQSQKFKLLIIDLIMPEEEGIETIVTMRQERPALRILAISGSSGPYLQVARFLGANESLIKPFSCSELLEKVELLLAFGANA